MSSSQTMKPLRRLVWAGVAFIGIVSIGVAGYMLIEGWSFIDALFMTITTITTVGFMEVHPLDSAGRLFTIFLIIGGVGGALYSLTAIVHYVMEGQLGMTLGRRRMKMRISSLKDHFILCGYGRVGEEIARTFSQEGVPFVVIDNREEVLTMVEQQGFPWLQGDATSDDVLKEAGIERARGIVAAVDSDTENTYITLSARGLRPDIFIAARYTAAEAKSKLEKAGANRVSSPYSVGGRRMAMLALRPTVVDFIDTVTYTPNHEMQLENIDIGRDSALAGKTMVQAREQGVTVLAVRKHNGRLMANPPDAETIADGDRLIVIGTRQKLSKLENIFEGKNK
jgi:voltage-gated potassium channel